MAYQKQTFTEGQTLTAENMNHIEAGIESAGTTANEALNKHTLKQDKLVSGANLKTINGQSLLGSGDISFDLNFDQRKQYGKYACIGDSISYGAYSSTEKTSWCDYLAEKLGATLQKRANNGLNIHAHMRTQLEGIKADTELVTIMMGVNDAYAYENNTTAGLELGDVATVINMENDYPDDYTKSALYANGLNVLGVFRWCLERLKRKLPNARIVVIAPLPSKSRDETVLHTIITGEIAICNALGVEVYAPGSDVLFDPTYFQNLYADGLHPNDAGYKVIAGWVYQRLGDVKQYEQVATYSITTVLNEVSGAASNATQIATSGNVVLTFTANSGYVLPQTVTVTGASYKWTQSTGKLIVYSPVSNVHITVTGVIDTDDGGDSGGDSGSTDQTATPYPAELGDSSLMTSSLNSALIAIPNEEMPEGATYTKIAMRIQTKSETYVNRGYILYVGTVSDENKFTVESTQTIVPTFADGVRDVVLDLPTPITAGANQRVGVRTAISENAWYYQSSGGKGFLYAINVKPNVGDTVDITFSKGSQFPFALIP